MYDVQVLLIFNVSAQTSVTIWYYGEFTRAYGTRVWWYMVQSTFLVLESNKFPLVQHHKILAETKRLGGFITEASQTLESLKSVCWKKGMISSIPVTI
ncbi:hypothetical protein L1887_26697 [Cichorium endivia]|nr:hypothetical protein L1887_26697 [Cichorium endivia]